MKPVFTSLVAAFFIFSSSSTIADSPHGCYALAEGKIGRELKSALYQIIAGHEVLPYTLSGNDDWFDRKKMDAWEVLLYTDSSCAVRYELGDDGSDEAMPDLVLRDENDRVMEIQGNRNPFIAQPGSFGERLLLLKVDRFWIGASHV